MPKFLPLAVEIVRLSQPKYCPFRISYIIFHMSTNDFVVHVALYKRSLLQMFSYEPFLDCV